MRGNSGSSLKGYTRQADMTPDQYTIYKRLKFKLLELLYKGSPYLSFQKVGKAMSVLWKQELASDLRKNLTLENCPYDPLPKSAVSSPTAVTVSDAASY